MATSETAPAVRGVSALQKELLKTKEHLNDVDENIKKLTGREPGDLRFPRRNSTGKNDFKGRERLFAAARRGVVDDLTSPPSKRRAFGNAPGRGALSRLGPRVITSRIRPAAKEDSAEEDESERPSLQSSIVVSDSKSRQDTIEQQNKDKAGKTRNRRMFGLLLGTLQRFKDEEKQKGDQDLKRKVVEQKLEEKALEEKEELKRERTTLFHKRHEQQNRLRRLEQKMELVEIHEDWEKQTKQLMNFIRTKAKPHIFFKPKLHHPASDKKRRETCKILEEIVIDRRRQLEEEIEELTKIGDDQNAEDEENDEGDSEEENKEEEVEAADDEHSEDERMVVERQKKRSRKSSESRREESESSKQRHSSRSKRDSYGSDDKRDSSGYDRKKSSHSSDRKKDLRSSDEKRERRHRKRTDSSRSRASEKETENNTSMRNVVQEKQTHSSPEHDKPRTALPENFSDEEKEISKQTEPAESMVVGSETLLESKTKLVAQNRSDHSDDQQEMDES